MTYLNHSRVGWLLIASPRNVKIFPFHLVSNLHMHIFKFWRHPRHCLLLATSKARVRYDMSNKQSLNFEKCIHFIFHYFEYSLHRFKPSTDCFGVWDIRYLRDLCIV